MQSEIGNWKSAMPTYEYVCSACGHEFEKFQSMSAAPIKACPECGKKKAQRKISVGAGFIFKGSGFYETDYRGDAYKKAADADKAPSGDAKADAKSDTKPDAKNDAKPAETKAETKVEAKPVESKPKSSSAKPAAKSASKSKRK